MISVLREKLALLADELGHPIYYTLDISSDHCLSGYPSQSERHRLGCSGYKTVYCVSAAQVLRLTKEHFIDESKPDADNV